MDNEQVIYVLTGRDVRFELEEMGFRIGDVTDAQWARLAAGLAPALENSTLPEVVQDVLWTVAERQKLPHADDEDDETGTA